MFPTFTALSAAWLALLAVPVIVFYFLKLRRPRQPVPSLVLWRQVLADQRVNSPFQRFKRNLLLLLQLLLLALLVLAAMQPVLRHTASRAARLPVLIDVSASMAALDAPGGKARLDAAKARARELIDQLPRDQEICLVAFAKNARRVTDFTNNQTELREALARLEVEDVPGELDEALRLAQALARTAPFDRVWLLSDGNFPARTQLELPFGVEFQRIAPGGSNFGITQCSARRALGGQWEVFVQLAGSNSAESTSGTLELRQGETVVARERVTLIPGGTPRFAFRLAGHATADLEVRYIPEGFDALASDNTAWLHLPAPRPLSVFTPETLASARHALAALEGVALYPDAGGAKQAGYDLLITDREADLAIPARVAATFALVPEDLQTLVTIEKEPAQAIDWRREAPVLQHVSLEEVLLGESPRSAGEVDESSYRALGYEPLADGPRGPLILERREPDQHRVHLLFHPERSTFIYRVGYPVFIANLVQAALRHAALSEVNAAATGVLPAVTVGAGGSVAITGPAGFRRSDTVGPDGQLVGVPAPRAGLYEFSGPGGRQQLGVALLSGAETSLAAVDQIEFPEQQKVAAATTAPRVDRSLWWLLACAALAVLALEWWWFHRRRVPA
jgi:hypothetical protein